MAVDPRQDEGEESIAAKFLQIRNELPEHFEPRCKVCTSKFRHAIERMIALGTSHSEIERVFNNEVPRRSISNHAKEHLSYEQAAIREIIAREAQAVNANYEEGVHGAVMYRTYLATALKKAWDDLVNGNARIDPAVAIQIIQQMDKLDRETAVAANQELHYQFNAFKTAVERVVPGELWEDIAEEMRRIVARGEEFGGELEE